MAKKRKKILKKGTRKVIKQIKKPNDSLFLLGNLLILLSLLSFLVILWPIITSYFIPRNIEDPSKIQGFAITVPKIKAQAPVISNVDPFNEKEYKEVLKKGVAHAQGTVLPHQRGNIFLFAHSSGAPWEISSYNTIFLRIGELDKGDEIILSRDRKIYKYKVSDEKIVWPWEVEALYEDKNQLVLQTCYPIGTSLKRLLIYAEPI